MIRRSTIVVIIFGIIVAALVGYTQLIKSQPPLEITVAVDPLAEAWVRKAAEEFNKTGALVNNGTTRVQVNVTSTENDITVWTGKSNWTFDKHPLLWIPSSSAALQYIPTNLPYKPLKASSARTPLVWGGFQSRVNALTKNDTLAFDWSAVNEALKAGTWAGTGSTTLKGNINMAINQPGSSMGGVAALISGAASLANSTTLDRSMVSGSAYEAWINSLSDAYRNLRNTGGSPAQAMAGSGVTADFALLPESQWLLSLSALARKEAFVLNYPAYEFVLDFPVALWDDATTTDVQRQAASAFANYLTSTVGQQLALSYGLRPTAGEPDTTATLFSTAIPYGILLEPTFTQVVSIPGRNEAETLLRALD